MATDQTERVLELFLSDPQEYVNFLAEAGGDPEQYGIETSTPEDMMALTPSTVGPALALYVALLSESQPTWAAIDGTAVDWPKAAAELELRLAQALGIENFL